MGTTSLNFFKSISLVSSFSVSFYKSIFSLFRSNSFFSKAFKSLFSKFYKCFPNWSIANTTKSSSLLSTFFRWSSNTYSKNLKNWFSLSSNSYLSTFKLSKESSTFTNIWSFTFYISNYSIKSFNSSIYLAFSLSNSYLFLSSSSLYSLFLLNPIPCGITWPIGFVLPFNLSCLVYTNSTDNLKSLFIFSSS